MPGEPLGRRSLAPGPKSFSPDESAKSPAIMHRPIETHRESERCFRRNYSWNGAFRSCVSMLPEPAKILVNSDQIAFQTYFQAIGRTLCLKILAFPRK